MKMEFRVPCETDMEKVRKIIKIEGRAVFEDPVSGDDEARAAESRGAARVAVSAMTVRAKFTAPAAQAAEEGAPAAPVDSR